MFKEVSQELLEFLSKSPTAFHAVENYRQVLNADGFKELLESEHWDIVPGGKYYVTRNNSSILAFKVGTKLDNYSFNIVTSHTDSPTFKVKENAEIEVKNKYTQLNTEGYGGMLCATWLDRPLSIAGRVLVEEGDNIVTKLINIDRDLLMIPNVAIHMNRAANEGVPYNLQVDMLPLLSGGEDRQKDFKQLIADELGVKKEAILGHDLYLYNRMAPSIWGANEEFISSGHLDDLQCGFASLKALLEGYNDESIDVMACFDNEEVGSGTKQGADSTLLSDTLSRINAALGKTDEDYHRALASSFMLSSDNAHAVHPNHPEHTDVNNCTYMNEGVVVKSHAGQKYTSDGVSMAVVKALASSADVPLQYFANRSDKAGGSTLGNIAMAQASMNAVDIGLPQLAMHSSYETAGVKDTYYAITLMKALYNAHIQETDAHCLKVTR